LSENESVGLFLWVSARFIRVNTRNIFFANCLPRRVSSGKSDVFSASSGHCLAHVVSSKKLPASTSRTYTHEFPPRHPTHRRHHHRRQNRPSHPRSAHHVQHQIGRFAFLRVHGRRAARRGRDSLRGRREARTPRSDEQVGHRHRRHPGVEQLQGTPTPHPPPRRPYASRAPEREKEKQQPSRLEIDPSLPDRLTRRLTQAMNKKSLAEVALLTESEAAKMFKMGTTRFKARYVNARARTTRRGHPISAIPVAFLEARGFFICCSNCRHVSGRYPKDFGNIYDFQKFCDKGPKLPEFKPERKVASFQVSPSAVRRV
jgi:hypothetical protein